MSLKEYTALKDMIARQAARLDAMEKRIASLLAQIDEMNRNAVRRGRPRKEDAQ